MTAQYQKLGETYVHIAIAERALEKPLPAGAEVHHVNENKRDNRPGNLVICQDRKYHALLHVRARVLRAGGDANTQRICTGCKQLVDICDLSVSMRRRGSVCRPCVSRSSTAAHQRNPAATAARLLAWSRANRDRINARVRARRALKKATGGR